MIRIPKSYNYCSAFITFACNLSCQYCINKFNGLHKYEQMSAKDWIHGLNKIITRPDLPITITGGEPTLHPEFFEIINGTTNPMDLLTNGKFDVNEFMNNVSPEKFKREAKYASIRFSFHPQNTNSLDLIYVVKKLQENGYSVGIWAVDNGDHRIRLFGNLTKNIGIDFRLKDYLSETTGTYKYPQGLDGIPKKCECKPSEMLIAPDGRLFRCHYDLYHGVNSYGHILDNEINLPTDFLPCENFGLCSPCDLKLKFNRFQEGGHCSVEING